MNERRGPGSSTYALVVVALAVYFGWILDRMAAFSNRGFIRLEKLGGAMGVVILTLAVVVVVNLIARRHRRRRQTAGSPRRGRAHLG